MIDPKQIPDEVVEATAIQIACRRLDENLWDQLDAEMKYFYRSEALAAIAAALNAWPDAYSVQSPPYAQAGVFLPLPQEGGDA